MWKRRAQEGKRGLGGQRVFTYIGKSPSFSESVNHKAIHKKTGGG